MRRQIASCEALFYFIYRLVRFKHPLHYGFFKVILGVPESPELVRLDRCRVVGLTIEPGQLLVHRKQRQIRLGAPGFSAYVDPTAVYEEIKNALQRFHEGGFSIIDVTDKTIETSADEIIRLVTRQVK